MPNIASIPYFIPEIVLIVFAVTVILYDLVSKKRGGEGAAYLALVGLVVAVITAIVIGSEDRSLFLGMVRLDSFAIFFKVIISVATAATILFSVRSAELDPATKGEYYALLLAVTLGMYLMASSTHLLMIYLSLETVSLNLLHPRRIPDT